MGTGQFVFGTFPEKRRSREYNNSFLTFECHKVVASYKKHIFKLTLNFHLVGILLHQILHHGIPAKFDLYTHCGVFYRIFYIRLS